MLTLGFGMHVLLKNLKNGELLYTIIHSKEVAFFKYFAGIYFANSIGQLTSIIFFTYTFLNRVFGHELKYGFSFNNSHFPF